MFGYSVCLKAICSVYMWGPGKFIRVLTWATTGCHFELIQIPICGINPDDPGGRVLRDYPKARRSAVLIYVCCSLDELEG